jgi:NAD(P)H-dependent glutamate synthase small subunit
MEFKRNGLHRRQARTRVKDWNELYEPGKEKQLKEQGARCMDCGVPFCMTGEEPQGVTVGCPIHNLIPEWNDLVYRGRWREAYDRLSKTNNFPEWTGRICPAPCESACVLGITDPAVTIKSIECSIIDKAFEEGWVLPQPPSSRTGKTVAVIGSGPAGLAAAQQLNRAGHRVTVFERDDRIGGLLMYGVPNMKLDKANVQRRVDILAAEGVEFVTNANVGVNVDIKEIQSKYDAILLACGALKGIDVKLPGRQLKGIHMAMDYLSQTTKSLLDSKFADGKCIDAHNKHVIVIGAGDTGTDCIGTALRQGCRSLVNFARKPQPPAERQPHNPWPQDADVYIVDYGHEEGRALFGKDPREYGVLTKEFIGDENGNLKAVRTVKVEWEFNPQTGEFGKATEIPGSQYDWPADLVFLAVGFAGPDTELVQKLGLETDRKSNVKAQFGKYATSVPGVFAAGDVRRGASLIVWAIAEGRGAARAIDMHLMGTSRLPE